MIDCTFCNIVAGRLPSYVVAQDQHTMAFLDASPAVPGHTLVVPRVHARDLWEISEVSHRQVADMVHRVAALLRTVVTPEGVNVTSSTGEAAGQDVFHFHVHVVPRWRGDDVRLTWKARPASADELQEILERLA
jgi:histidine triad (HIT) family protein